MSCTASSLAAFRCAAANAMVIALFFSPPGLAQFDPGASADLGAGYGQIALSQSIMAGIGQSEAAGSASSEHERALRLYWRDGVSLQFRQAMIDSLSSEFQLSKPAAQELLKDVNPLAGFQEVTHKNGLDMFNIADLLTTYCVVSWEIVHGRNASAAGINSLNRRIRDSIGRQESVLTRVQQLTDKEKQFWLESLAYGAMLNRRSIDIFQQQGETERVRNLREFVVSSAARTGIDLNSLEL